MPASLQERERLLQKLAAAQHGIADHGQLRELGFAAKTIYARAQAGLLVRVFHGVYLLPPHPLTRDAREMAALRSCGPEAAIGLRSAAARDGLLIWDGPVEVVVPTHQRRQRGLHPRAFPLERWDVTVVGGLRRTTRARTLADLPTVLGVGEIERVVHEAEFRKQLVATSVRRAIERAGRRRNTAALEAALTRRRRLVGSLDSGPERRFARFLGERGYPPTEHNVPFLLGGSEVRLDVLFRSAWLGVEVDGDPHKSERQFHADRQRDLRFEAEHGLTIVRVTEPQIDDGPDDLDRLLWRTLLRRDPALRRGAPSFQHPIARKHL